MRKHLPTLPAVATAVTALVALGIEAPRPARGQDAQGPPLAQPRLAQPPALPQPARSQDAQATPSQITVGGVTITGYSDDWSTHHLVFSDPGTEEDAIKNGKHAQWLRIVEEPRYIMQQVHRRALARGPHAAEVAALEAALQADSVPGAAQGTNASELDQEKKPRMHKDWSEDTGTGALAANTFPSKWTYFTSTFSCTGDVLVVPTGALGSSSGANTIIYYTNLYSGCGGTVPTGHGIYTTGYETFQSPVSNSTGTTVVYPLSTGSAPSYICTLVLSSATSSCVELSGAGLDGWSNPFYDYTSDSLWVGDDSGKLHKFHPVFNGTLTEITSGWPVTLSSTSGITEDISSPVYDPVSGCVFVGSLGGYLYSVQSGIAGTVCTSTSSGSVYASKGPYTSCYGIEDGPLVDSTQGNVYFFSQDYSTSGTNYYDIVLQWPTSSSGTPNIYQIGEGERYGSSSSSPCTTLGGPYAGAFDNVYLNSSVGTGNLYAAGFLKGPTTLYKLPININTVGTLVAGPAIENSSYQGAVSPVTEFCNNSGNPCTASSTQTTAGVDYLFVSSFYNSNVTSCNSSSHGCVMSFTVTNPANFTSSLAPNTPMEVTASGTPTTGIIIDNSSTEGGASEIYFVTLFTNTCSTSGGSGLCAIQTSQSLP